MAKLCVFCYYIILFGIVPCGGQVGLRQAQSDIRQAQSDKVASIVSEDVIRKSVFDTAYYYSKIVREPYKAGMNNKHWAITKFNRSMKIAATSPYCSTFGIFCWAANGIRFPGVNGMAYSWRQSSKMVWHRGFLALDEELWPKIKVMDAVVCTWSHVEFVAPISEKTMIVKYGKSGIVTIAGNTRGGNNRGEGVYYPIQRPMAYIFGVYDHFSGMYLKDRLLISNQYLISIQ